MMENVKKATQKDVDFGDYVQNFRPGDHVIALYSKDEQRDAIVRAFISHLLKSDSLIMYVTSERSPEFVRKNLVQNGIDAPEYEKKALLFIQDGYYTIPPNIGTNHAEEGKKMIAAFAKTVYTAKKGALGGVVETEGLFRYNLVEPLLSTESFFGKTLGDIYHEKMPPMMGLCLYRYDNLLSIDGERQAGLIDSHSHAFFATPESESLKAEVESFVTGVSRIVHQSLPSRWIVVPEGWDHASVSVDGRQILVLLNKSKAIQQFLQVPGYHSGKERRVGENKDRLALMIETITPDLRYRVEPRIRELLPSDLRYLHMIFW